MAETLFKGAGYVGAASVFHINRFTFGPMPPRARLFNQDIQKKCCTEYHEAAWKFLISQDYLNEGPGVQELIPGEKRCTEYHEAAWKFLISQDYLNEGPGVQELIPGVEPEPAKKPMEVLVWHTGFRLLNNELVFEIELRTSDKLPTKARKIIGDTLSRAFKACVGNIERQGGVPGDLAPADDLVTPREPDLPPSPNDTIPVIP